MRGFMLHMIRSTHSTMRAPRLDTTIDCAISYAGILGRAIVLQASSLPAPEDPGVRRTEPPTPLPNRLVRHGDAPLREEIFGIAEAHTEPVVEPDGVTDDVRRESVAVVAGGRARHRPTLPAAAST